MHQTLSQKDEIEAVLCPLFSNKYSAYEVGSETIINARSMPWSFGCTKRRLERTKWSPFYGFARFTPRASDMHRHIHMHIHMHLHLHTHTLLVYLRLVTSDCCTKAQLCANCCTWNLDLSNRSFLLLLPWPCFWLKRAPPAQFVQLSPVIACNPSSCLPGISSLA